MQRDVHIYVYERIKYENNIRVRNHSEHIYNVISKVIITYKPLPKNNVSSAI